MAAFLCTSAFEPNPGPGAGPRRIANVADRPGWARRAVEFPTPCRVAQLRGRLNPDRSRAWVRLASSRTNRVHRMLRRLPESRP